MMIGPAFVMFIVLVCASCSKRDSSSQSVGAVGGSSTSGGLLSDPEKNNPVADLGDDPGVKISSDKGLGDVSRASGEQCSETDVERKRIYNYVRTDRCIGGVWVSQWETDPSRYGTVLNPLVKLKSSGTSGGSSRPCGDLQHGEREYFSSFSKNSVDIDGVCALEYQYTRYCFNGVLSYTKLKLTPPSLQTNISKSEYRPENRISECVQSDKDLIQDLEDRKIPYVVHDYNENLFFVDMVSENDCQLSQWDSHKKKKNSLVDSQGQPVFGNGRLRCSGFSFYKNYLVGIDDRPADIKDTQLRWLDLSSLVVKTTKVNLVRTDVPSQTRFSKLSLMSEYEGKLYFNASSFDVPGTFVVELDPESAKSRIVAISTVGSMVKKAFSRDIELEATVLAVDSRIFWLNDLRSIHVNDVSTNSQVKVDLPVGAKYPLGFFKSINEDHVVLGVVNEDDKVYGYYLSKDNKLVSMGMIRPNANFKNVTYSNYSSGFANVYRKSNVSLLGIGSGRVLVWHSGESVASGTVDEKMKYKLGVFNPSNGEMQSLDFADRFSEPVSYTSYGQKWYMSLLRYNEEGKAKTDLLELDLENDLVKNILTSYPDANALADFEISLNDPGSNKIRPNRKSLSIGDYGKIYWSSPAALKIVRGQLYFNAIRQIAPAANMDRQRFLVQLDPSRGTVKALAFRTIFAFPGVHEPLIFPVDGGATMFYGVQSFESANTLLDTFKGQRGWYELKK